MDSVAYGGGVEFSRAGSPRIHALVGSQAPGATCIKFSTYGDYLVVERGSLDWAGAWSGRLRFTWDDPEQSNWLSTDVHMVIDAADEVNLAYEEHEVAGDIGYRRSSTAGWAAPAPATAPTPPELPTIGGPGGSSPSLFVEEKGSPGVEEDVVHVIWQQGPGSDDYWHNWKLVPDSATAWGTPTVLSKAFNNCQGLPGEGGVAPAFAVTAGGMAHLVGRCRHAGGTASIYHVRAVWEPDPPPGHWTEIDTTILETMPQVEAQEPEGDVASDVSLELLRSGVSEILHASWNFNNSDGTREIHYARYDVGDTTWSSIVDVTGTSGEWSTHSRLFQDANGTLHMLYHEKLRSPDLYFSPDSAVQPCDQGRVNPAGYAATLFRNELRYVYATGDPTIEASWSDPQPFTSDMRTAFLGPSFVAENDTLWVLFTSHDDEDDALGDGLITWKDGNWEAWFRKSVPMGAVVQAGQTVTWSGVVWLDRDFLVEAGGTLVIAPGTVIVASASAQGANLGNQEGRVELVVEGRVLVNGEPANRVKFTSAVKTRGAWGGILFRDTPDMRVSRLDFVDFEYPVIGAQLDSLSGNLFHPRFTDCEQHEIYLDRDTRIPKGYEWNLVGPTTVKMLADADSSGRGEDPTRIEIVPNGAIRTQAGPSGERVVFTSTAPDATNGDDWYGMTVFGTGWPDSSGMAEISGAEFGYAKFPLSLFLADRPEVRESHFHHYEKTAITDWGSDATIADCFVERGDFLLSTIGETGIHVYESFATVERDTVTAQLQSGIRVERSKTGCLVAPPDPTPGVVTVSDATVVGNAELSPTATGVLVRWICDEMRVGIHENKIQGWGTGIRVNNSADVHAGCNCVKANGVGVEHERRLLLYSDDPGRSWLKENNLDQNTSVNMRAKGGPSSLEAAVYLGRHLTDGGSRNNRLMADSNQSLNYEIAGGGIGRIDSAYVNKWYNENGGGLDSTTIPDYLKVLEGPTGDPLQTVQFAGFESAVDPECSTASSDCDVSGLPLALQGPRSRGDVEDRADTGVPAGLEDVRAALPTEFRLAVPRPSPARSGAVVDFAVPAPGIQRVQLAVYDVRGRRVRVLHEGSLEAGWHEFTWDLRDSTGRRVGTGMYFVRISSPSYTRVEKLVVLR